MSLKMRKTGDLPEIDLYFPGGRLNPNNRWVKMAAMFSWKELEAEYAHYFPSHELGKAAVSCRIVLGALLVKEILV